MRFRFAVSGGDERMARLAELLGAALEGRQLQLLLGAQ